MKTEDSEKNIIENSEFDISQIYSELVVSAIIAFVMVLNSIANTDIGGIFQQILNR